MLYGNGAGSIQATSAGNTNQCLVGNTGLAPSWGSCGAGGGITGSGTINTVALFSSSGTIANSILSQDVNATTVTTTGNVNITGTATAANFSGNGSSLTSLNGTNIASGTVDDARLSNNVALLNNTQTLTGAKTFSALLTATNGLSVTGTMVGTSTIQGTSLISTVTTGTAPLQVASTTQVANLNADLLDGYTASDFAQASSLGNYVLKAGDTMSGNLNMGTNKLIGGTTVTDILKLQGTTGNGTLTSPAIQLLTGNNGGTTALTVLNNGNVGVGTASPSAKFNVLGSAISGGTITGTSSGILRVGIGGAYNESDTIAIDFGSGGSNDTLPLARIATKLSYLGSSLLFGTSNLYASGVTNTALAINPAGNVGIGTISPIQRLHIVGDTDHNAVGPVLIQSNGTTNIGTAITLDASSIAGGKKYSFISTGASAAGGAGDFAVFNSSNTSYVFRFNGDGVMRVGKSNLAIDTNAQLTVMPYTAGTIGQIIKGAASQTADLFQIQNSGGTVLGSVSATGGVLLGNSSNQVNAFRVQRASLDNVLLVDTSGNKVKIGNDGAGSGSDTTIFVVDSATTANAPNGVNGGMYYDTTIGRLRCYQSGAWSNCDGGGSGNYVQNGTTLQTANFNIQSAAAGSIGAIIKGAISQTANLLEIQNSSDNKLFVVDSAGKVGIGTASPSQALSVLGNILIDGIPSLDKALILAENGVNEWAIQAPKNQDGRFLNLYNYPSDTNVLTFEETGRVGINKQSNVMNYHPTYTGTAGVGLNDMNVGGTYTGDSQTLYEININGVGTPNTWRWRKSTNFGTTWSSYSSTANVSNTLIAVDNGITVKWDNLTGHTTANTWQFTAFPSAPQGTLTVAPNYFKEIQKTLDYTAVTPIFEDLSGELNTSTDKSSTPLAAGTTSAFYVAGDTKFRSLYVNMRTTAGSAGIGVTGIFEYWNGSTWATLTVTDRTANFAQSGVIIFDKPADWVKNIPTGMDATYNYYWIRVRSSTNVTTAPVVSSFSRNGDKRFTVYSANLDSTPSFAVMSNGNTMIGNNYDSVKSKLTVGNTNGTTSKLVTISDVANPTSLAGANGMLVALQSGGGIYMKSETGSVEGKYEAFNGSLQIGSMSGHPLGLYSSNQVRMTIDTVGNVGVGVVSPLARLHIEPVAATIGQLIKGAASQTANLLEIQDSSAKKMVQVSATGRLGIANTSPSYLLHVGSSTVTTGTSVAQFENAGGTCTVTPSTAGGITCTSDIRLKKDITTINPTNVLDKLMGIDTISYHMNAESSTDQLHVGFNAQQLESILPDLVVTDANGFKGVSYAGLTPYLVAGMQAQQSQIDKLAKDIKDNQNLQTTATIQILANQDLSIANLNVSGTTNLTNLTVANVIITNSLTVQNLVTTNLTINGHIVTAGKTPTITPQVAAGQGATATIDGNDTAGKIVISTGANPVSGELAKIDFTKTFNKLPKIVATPQDGSTAIIQPYATPEPASFTIGAAAKLDQNQIYVFSYFVIE